MVQKAQNLSVSSLDSTSLPAPCATHRPPPNLLQAAQSGFSLHASNLLAEQYQDILLYRLFFVTLCERMSPSLHTALITANNPPTLA